MKKIMETWAAVSRLSACPDTGERGVLDSLRDKSGDLSNAIEANADGGGVDLSRVITILKCYVCDWMTNAIRLQYLNIFASPSAGGPYLIIRSIQRRP